MEIDITDFDIMESYITRPDITGKSPMELTKVESDITESDITKESAIMGI